MARKLTVTRAGGILNQGLAPLKIVLDGVTVGKLHIGKSMDLEISEDSHILEVEISPVKKLNPEPVVIDAGSNYYTVSYYCKPKLGIAFWDRDVVKEAPVCSWEKFSTTVAAFMVKVFQGPGIMKRINDPNNSRQDVSVSCAWNGVYVGYQTKVQKTREEWLAGGIRELIPYADMGVCPPDGWDQKKLEYIVEAAIVNKTNFVKNRYGGFVPGKPENKLY